MKNKLRKMPKMALQNCCLFMVDILLRYVELKEFMENSSTRSVIIWGISRVLEIIMMTHPHY